MNDDIGVVNGMNGMNGMNGISGTPPDLPPRIDRASKPIRSATVSGRTAQERLFGNMSSKEHSEPPNYINATTHHRLQNLTSLERHNSTATSITNTNNKTVGKLLSLVGY